MSSKKYAVNNSLLTSLSALDPTVRGYSKAHSCLLKLLPYFSSILSNDEQYTAEISKELSSFESGACIDCWWNGLSKTCNYPSLSKMVKAALSIFTGPQIQASFRMINDIIHWCSSRMDVATYSVIMNVKCGPTEKMGYLIFNIIIVVIFYEILLILS